MLIELYRVEQTQASYWITNITGKIDYVSFYLPFPLVFFRSQVQSSSGLPYFFQEIFKLTVYLFILFLLAHLILFFISIFFFFFFFFFIYLFIFFFFFGNRSATQNCPVSFLISNNLRFAKRLQICLHYVVKFKRPLEIYEAFTYKKERKRGFYHNSSSVCCSRCMIMAYAIHNPFWKKKKKKKKDRGRNNYWNEFLCIFFLFL